jgi:hypothetical protein
VNVVAFLAFLQDGSEVWTALVTVRSTNDGRGIGLVNFVGVFIIRRVDRRYS